MNQLLDDPNFPQITYRRSASKRPVPILRGTGIRVRTIVAAAQQWGLPPAQIGAEYDLGESQVKEALAFYQVHQEEIDASLTAEQSLEPSVG